jgi:putative heme iron utilization protein
MCAGTCFLATASAELDGHPFGSVVDVAADAQGRPLFCISTLSGHTKDLAQDARCSVTVQQPSFQGIQDGRCTLVGTVTKVRERRRAVFGTKARQEKGRDGHLSTLRKGNTTCRVARLFALHTR